MPEIAERLGVPLTEVVKSAMGLGLRYTSAQPLADEDARLVEKLIRLDRRS